MKMNVAALRKSNDCRSCFNFCSLAWTVNEWAFSIFATITIWQQIKDGYLCLRNVNWKRNQTKRRHFDVNVVTTFDNEYMHITKLAATNYAKDKLHLTLNLICQSTNEAKSGRSISLFLCVGCVSVPKCTHVPRLKAILVLHVLCLAFGMLCFVIDCCRLCMDIHISLTLDVYAFVCRSYYMNTVLFFFVYAMASSTSDFPLLSPFQTKLLMLCS